MSLVVSFRSLIPLQLLFPPFLESLRGQQKHPRANMLRLASAKWRSKQLTWTETMTNFGLCALAS